MKEGFRCEMGYLQQQLVGMPLRWGKERAFSHHSLRGWRHASTSPLSLRSFATKSQIQVFFYFLESGHHHDYQANQHRQRHKVLLDFDYIYSSPRPFAPLPVRPETSVTDAMETS